MRDVERNVLENMRLNWAPTPTRVWHPPEAHVAGLNEHVYRIIRAAFLEAKDSDEESPLGVVVEGQQGSGKTHLLSWTREHAQREGGYFFLAGLTRGRDFWPNIVQTLVRDLSKTGSHAPQTQLQMLLERLADAANVDDETRDRVIGALPLTPLALSDFEKAVRRMAAIPGQDFRNTLRAMAMVAAKDLDIQDIGDGFLLSRLDDATDEWKRWGLPVTRMTPQDTAEQISRVLSLTGPTVLAFDQIDTIFAQSRQASDDDDVLVPLADDLGSGLMEIRQGLRRTVLVVACLRRSWDLIREHAPGSVTGRFRREAQLGRLPSEELARELVARHFKKVFDQADFKPPYPTWPVPHDAFSHALDLTPRLLLQRVDWHVRACLRAGSVLPLNDLMDATEDTGIDAAPPAASRFHIAALDDRFQALIDEVSVDAALSPDTEDAELPGLLVAGLQAWVTETGNEQEYVIQPGEGRTPVFHAMLRHILDPETDDEEHWSFRGIAKEHHRAVIARIERLQAFAALDPQITKRSAVILRPTSTNWSTGPMTTHTREAFESAGGHIVEPSPADLKVFAALRIMQREADPALTAWLKKRRPAMHTGLLSHVLGRFPTNTRAGRRSHDGPDPPAGLDVPSPAADAILLGTDEDGVALYADLESLRKHVAIFAGSGSGKTVLIRRLVEQCALHGISSIVLDPNNDLARLGDPWPVPPDGWGSDDAALAADYLRSAEVVIWTPRRESGRPLSLQPLPDLAAVLDDPDDFAIALDIAVAALAPRARVGGNTAKMERGRAILREALSHFAHRGGGRLSAFIDLLGDLPDNAATLARAADIAHDMAQTLTAAMINDPLFGGTGTPLDPGVLLTPVNAKRARVSVISLIGLTTDEQRQGFVNQLQMGLMTWIKAHPAGVQPLNGLFVMDEAQTLAPSGSTTASTESTLALASQARKYGLGLVFATQAPRGIHNRIVGNAATQFYGFLNSPTQIGAVKEMAQAKASSAIDVSRLSAGDFYVSREGVGFSRISVPMCLSHHPKSALSVEEVLDRARR